MYNYIAKLKKMFHFAVEIFCRLCIFVAIRENIIPEKRPRIVLMPSVHLAHASLVPSGCGLRGVASLNIAIHDNSSHEMPKTDDS